MAAHEVDNRAERTETRQTNDLSSLAPDLLLKGSVRQLNQVESAATMANNGFPKMELVDSNSPTMKADSSLRFSSQFVTGNELTSDKELHQAGLDPKNIKHKVEKEDGGKTQESTTVKYPNGLEVTVTGSTVHKANGHDGHTTPVASIKEPLPKGFHKDDDGGIVDDHNKKIAQINKEGTVTIQVGKGYLEQSPAGVTEATVVEHRDGSGMAVQIPVKHEK